MIRARKEWYRPAVDFEGADLDQYIDWVNKYTARNGYNWRFSKKSRRKEPTSGRNRGLARGSLSKREGQMDEAYVAFIDWENDQARSSR